MVAAELAPRAAVPVREVVTRVVGAAVQPAEPVHTYEPGAVRGADPHLPSTATLTLTPTPTPTSTSTRPTIAAPKLVPRATEEPLTSDLSRLHLTVSRRFLAKLAAARSARGHARPGATAEAILEEALDLLLAKQAKRREARTDRPLATPRPSGTDQVPDEVRRAVWLRDQGRCQWPIDSGGICGSTHRLELDHCRPKARGGPPTIANLRVLCHAHNAEAARRAFGAPWMARWSGRTRPR